jgi:hypothetical protein
MPTPVPASWIGTLATSIASPADWIALGGISIATSHSWLTDPNSV